MNVQTRIGELLRRRRGAIAERCKSRLLAETTGRDNEKRNGGSLSILDRVPELVEAMAQDIANGRDTDAVTVELSARASGLVDLAEEAGEVALGLLHLRAAVADELRDDWPEMTAEAWRPIERAIDSALGDVIRRSERIRAEKVGALEETLRTQHRFIAVLGHDLRSSLNGISGFAQLLQRELDVARHGRPVQRILGIVGRMDRLIGDVLDLARAQGGVGIALYFDRVDLNELCQSAVGVIERERPGRVRFSPTSSVIIDCDPQRMSQVIANLLASALTKASDGTTVDVRLSNRDSEATVTLQYQGPPIGAELITQAFDPFRSDRRPTDLGLCVAREIVIAHGGTLEMQSSESGESAFCLRIPHSQNRTGTA